MDQSDDHYDIAEGSFDVLRDSELKTPPSVFHCPECGGALWEMNDEGFLRYRCHVGHGFTAERLAAELNGEVELALWAAISRLEETAALSQRLAESSALANHEEIRGRYQTNAAQKRRQADLIRQLLLDRQAPSGSEAAYRDLRQEYK